MDILICVERLSFLIFVCVFYIGSSSAQMNNRNPFSEESKNNNQGSSYFFYQTSEYPRDCSEVREQCSLSNLNGVYIIKPDGYPDPFEVYCNNDTDSGVWTVIHRRLDGSFSFGRNWGDYKKGFGFPSNEFWIGNGRLSFLTNQKVYELQIDMFLPNGMSFHVMYNSFRISDEWGNFTLVAVGDYTGDADSFITSCPQNTVYPGCTCEATCEDPMGTSDCQTNCDQNKICVCQEGLLMKEGSCVTPRDCGCYISEENRFISNGETFLNANCTKHCTCNGYQLSCDTQYACSSDATCNVGEYGLRQCNCKEGYTGDGLTCTMDVIRDCKDVLDAGNTQDGVYTILPSGWSGAPFEVFCNMTIDGGGWTVFQRRDRGATGFYNNWANYKNGFGDIQDEFWLGNDKLHYLTQQGTNELRIDFVSSSNSAKYAKYSRFRVDSETNKYRVTDIGTYSGNGGDAMNNVEDEYFSTHDRDNDELSYNCAEKHQAGWWHGGINYSDYLDRYCGYWYHGHGRSYTRTCSESNLNGDYNGGNGKNIYWIRTNYCHIKYTEMKIRRLS